MRVSKVLAAVGLVALVAGVAACSGSDDPATEVNESTLVEPSTTSASEPSAPATSDGADDTRPAVVSGDATGSFPGGVAGVEVLTDRNWVTEDGRVVFGETAPDDDVQVAICDYLFGTVDEVAATAELPGTVELFDDSGYTILGSNGTGFRCGYSIDGTVRLALILWDTDLGGDADAGGTALTELSNGLYGGVVYDPEWTGETMDPVDADQWIAEAGARVDTP